MGGDIFWMCSYGTLGILTTSDPLLKTYLANRSRFVSWVTGMVRCPAHAEDIVQEAFIRMTSASKQGVVVFSPIA